MGVGEDPARDHLMARARKRTRRWPSAVVFDLDGTLVDSAPDILSALNHGMAVAGRPPVAEEAGRRAIGLGLEGMVEQALAGSGGLPDSAALEAITRAAVRFYDAHLIVRTRPFPGVAEALAGLSARGVRMGICTNKRLAPAQHILAGLGLGDYFEAVIARESCPQRKPHPAPLHATLRALGVSPADSVMVGDSLVDVECARAAGIPVVAVAHGYSEVPVQELAADVIIESCAALMEALEAMAR